MKGKDKKLVFLLIILFSVILADFSFCDLFNTNTIIIVQQFQNKSEYKGKWKIGQEYTKLFKEVLEEEDFHNIKIIKSETSFSNLGNNTLIISGDIKKFKFKEYIFAAYRFGGYKNYTVDIEIQLKLNSKDSTIEKEKLIESYISRKNYGITLLGGPGTTDDFETNPYHELQKIPFGSRKFWGTIYGIGVQDSLEKMRDWLKELKKK